MQEKQTVRYELVAQDGRVVGIYATARQAAEDLQEGWSIRLAGSDYIHQRAERGPVKV